MSNIVVVIAVNKYCRHFILMIVTIIVLPVLLVLQVFIIVVIANLSISTG